MNREWVETTLVKRYQELKEHKEKILNFIQTSDIISEDDKHEFIEDLNAATAKDPIFMLDSELKLYPIHHRQDGCIESLKDWTSKIEELKIDVYQSTLRFLEFEFIDRYLDREPMEFDGDIIITDPCYIVKDDTRYSTRRDDWKKCDYGDNMEALGIKTYMTRDTLYGDWSCTTFNTDTGERIGSFCADAGLVSVFLLDEVLKYNPNYDDHINNTYAVTWIKDFKGTVQFVVVRTEGIYEDTTDYHKAGEAWEDFSVEVVGHGINKVTGESINFVGKQSGF